MKKEIRFSEGEFIKFMVEKSNYECEVVSLNEFKKEIVNSSLFCRICNIRKMEGKYINGSGRKLYKEMEYWI